MAITAPYSFYPIKIASASGGGTITFEQLQEPIILPNFSRPKRSQSVDFTRPTSANSPGKRVFTAMGCKENYWDLSLNLPMVFPNDLNTLVGWYNSSPGVCLVSIDGGTNRYYGLWKEDGLKPFSYPYNQREFYRVELDFHIIGKATTAFDNMDPVDPY